MKAHELLALCLLAGCLRSSAGSGEEVDASRGADAGDASAPDAGPKDSAGDEAEASSNGSDAGLCAPTSFDRSAELYGETSPDFDPKGPHYVTDYLPVERFTVLGTPREGAPMRVVLETTLPNDCWQLTSLHTASSHEHERLVFVALRAWRVQQEDGGCEGPSRADQRLVTISKPMAGCWTFADFRSSGRLDVEVPPCDPATEPCACEGLDTDRRVGDACRADCQCTRFGNLCALNDAGEGVCRKSCSGDGDCASGRCGGAESDWLCESHRTHQCDVDGDCPDPHVCRDIHGARSCFPDHDLRGLTRHACTRNADCTTPGLVCTLDNAPGGTGLATCNVPCFSRHGVCPGPHTCLGDTAVCEWVGE